jgi:hypothetical protein
MNGDLLFLTFAFFLAHFLVLFSTVRKGYRIQADKERDSMKVLYYVEKELAQFDPARRMRGRCKHLLFSCGLCITQDLVVKEDLGVIKLGSSELARSEPAGVLVTPLKKVTPSIQKRAKGTPGVKGGAVKYHLGS